MPAYREELALVCDFIGQPELGKTGRAALDRALDLSRNLAERFPNCPKLPRIVFGRVSLNGARIAQPAGAARRRIVCAQVDRRAPNLSPALHSDLPEFLNVSLGLGLPPACQAPGSEPRTPPAQPMSGPVVSRKPVRPSDKPFSTTRRRWNPSPESPRYRDYLWEDYVHESPILRERSKIEPDVPTRRRMIEDAAKDAERLVGILPDDTDSYVQAATSLVKCGQAAG